MRRSLIRYVAFSLGEKLKPSKSLGYEMAISANFKSPCIILVSPTLDQNVGSVARAMLNFGLHDLRIVNPECNIHSDLALALSCGAEKVLENAKVFQDLKSCIGDLNKVMATTVRPRDMNTMVYSPSAAANGLLNNQPSFSSGIVFGRESNGLTNDEIALADSIITIPTFGYFSSINLAQSVNIVGYEVYKRRKELENVGLSNTTSSTQFCSNMATKEAMENFLSRLEDKLTQTNYRFSEGQRARKFQIIRTMFQRFELDSTEVSVLQGILSSLSKDDPKDLNEEQTPIKQQ